MRGYAISLRREAFIVAAARDSGSRAPSEKVFALLCWRRQQEDPPGDGADRRIKDWTLAGQRCAARADRAPSRRRRGPQRNPAGPLAQLRSPRAGGEAG